MRKEAGVIDLQTPALEPVFSGPVYMAATRPRRWSWTKQTSLSAGFWGRGRGLRSCRVYWERGEFTLLHLIKRKLIKVGFKGSGNQSYVNNSRVILPHFSGIHKKIVTLHGTRGGWG